MVKARHGTQETIASVKSRLEILDDATTMPREAVPRKAGAVFEAEQL